MGHKSRISKLAHETILRHSIREITKNRSHFKPDVYEELASDYGLKLKWSDRAGGHWLILDQFTSTFLAAYWSRTGRYIRANGEEQTLTANHLRMALVTAGCHRLFPQRAKRKKSRPLQTKGTASTPLQSRLCQPLTSGSSRQDSAPMLNPGRQGQATLESRSVKLYARLHESVVASGFSKFVRIVRSNDGLNRREIRSLDGELLLTSLDDDGWFAQIAGDSLIRFASIESIADMLRACYERLKEPSVRPGRRVVLRYQGSGEMETYLIVNGDQYSLDREEEIREWSPLGMQICGTRIGDRVTVHLPTKVVDVEVADII